MGEADTYVAGALGAIFGVKGILIVLLFGLFASMFFIIPSFWYNKYKLGDKYVCILMILFGLMLVVYKSFTNYFVLGILGILTVMLIYSLLKGIRQEKSRTYFPYVPALAAGALYGLIIM